VEQTRELFRVRGLVAAARARGLSVGFVPTMGALHDGHLSLMRQARSASRFVVVSIFVNPAQFAPGEDFERYPRSPEKDAALCEAAGVDLLYAPDAPDFYPGDFATSIRVAGVTDGGEGAIRPGHFPGVAAAVAKLFLRVQPDMAFFGRKDLQQVAVVRRLIRDLDFPVELVVGETVRDADGLALSSRNAYLSAEDRRLALALPRSLSAAKTRTERGERDPQALERATRKDLEDAGLSVDYADVVDAVTMRRPARVEPGTALAAAVRVGKTRLIDNVLLLEVP
jgi:pantoate--beta-alanine ligase